MDKNRWNSHEASATSDHEYLVIHWCVGDAFAAAGGNGMVEGVHRDRFVIKLHIRGHSLEALFISGVDFRKVYSQIFKCPLEF